MEIHGCSTIHFVHLLHWNDIALFHHFQYHVFGASCYEDRSVRTPREIGNEGLRPSTMVAARLARLIKSTDFEEKVRIIKVVQDDKPLSILHVADPVVNELEDIGKRALPLRNLD